MATFRAEDGPAGLPRPNGIDVGLPASNAAAEPGEIILDGQADFKDALREQLLARVPPDWLERLSEPELRPELARLAKELAYQDPRALDYQEQEALIDQVLDEVLGYGPLGSLIRQADISEILINGPHQVYVERRGQLQASEATFRDEEHLLQVIRKLIARTGRRLDRKSPMVDARLQDGSRLNAVLKPPALNGPLVSIRRFGLRPLTSDDLLANESVAKEMLDFLAACVQARFSIIISGGTGSGKTTLLNALSRFVPGSERLVTIEDTAELELQQPHVAKMESQPPDQEGEGGVTMRDLVRNALRMRPDRIIVGECRGGEALEMMQAMNTGHEGSMTTVHANSTREALSRIELMVGLAGVEIPVEAIRKLIASSINLIVQVARLPGGKRKIVTISEIIGMEGDIVSMHDLFVFAQTGIDLNHGAEGYFRATGMRPALLNKLNVRGANVPLDWFIERPLLASRGRGGYR
jgi:pilus assembly protein CpaF